MLCKLEDLRNRDVVQIKTGICLGRVDDIVIDTCCAEVRSLVIYGRRKCFGLLGREDDMIIPWKDISVLGDDVVLVCFEDGGRCEKRRRNPFSAFFST